MGMPTGEQMGLANALVRMSFLLNSVYAEVAREQELTPQQGKLLCVLMERPYGMRELGEVLGLAKSSLTGLVDRTAQHGLVRREPDPQDARAVQVAITGPGAEIADRFHNETCRRVEELPADLDADDRDRLTDLLARTVHANADRGRAVWLEPDECNGGAPPAEC